jgi:hypothetical protein
MMSWFRFIVPLFIKKKNVQIYNPIVEKKLDFEQTTFVDNVKNDHDNRKRMININRPIQTPLEIELDLKIKLKHEQINERNFSRILIGMRPILDDNAKEFECIVNDWKKKDLEENIRDKEYYTILDRWNKGEYNSESVKNKDLQSLLDYFTTSSFTTFSSWSTFLWSSS